MPGITVADTFAGTSGAQVDSRPPTTPDLGSVWSVALPANFICQSGPQGRNTANSNNAVLSLPSLPGSAELVSLVISCEIDKGGATAFGGSFGGISVYGVGGNIALTLNNDSGGGYATSIEGSPTFGSTSGTVFDLEIACVGGTATFKINGTTVRTGSYSGLLIGGSDTVAQITLAANGLIARDFSFVASYTAEPDPPEPPTGYHNVLIKNTVVNTVPGSVDVPGSPYVPAQPGRYVSEKRRVCGWKYQGPGHYEAWVDPRTQQTTYVWIPESGSYGNAIWTCEDITVMVYYPPTPAQPARPGFSLPTVTYETGYNLGWNSGARSRAIFTADVRAQFQASPSNVGTIVGLNIDDGTPVTFNGNTINYGFYLARGVARLIQNGVLGASVGGYTNDTLFEIFRTDDAINYRMDGVSVGTASGAPTGPGWLEAAMYSGEDVVYNPQLEIVTSAPVVDGEGTMAGNLRQVTGLMTQGAHADMAAELPHMTGVMTAGALVPTYALMSGQISIFSGEITGLTGGVGQIAGQMHQVQGLMADHAYGAMEGAISPPIEGFMSALDGNFRASMASGGLSAGWMSARQVFIATMTSTGQVLTTMQATISLRAQMLSTLQLAGTLAFASIEQALMFSLLMTRALVVVPDGAELETWVVEMEGGSFGSTEYTGFDFNSYATIGGRPYGASRKGLYLLEGETDNGAKIAASIDYGRMDFGTVTKKTISECFVGVASSGAMYLKVIVEGQPYVYRCDWQDEELQQQRFKLGKGMKSTYITPILYNADGADFELDSVQFVAADLSRKL